MNDKIGFRFYTRTLSEDYRVFANDGSELLDYEEEFEPLLEKAEIESDDDAGAVIFTENGKIYLAAFGLRTNRQDRVGRTIRFSFCQIFHETRMNLAMNAFCRIADEWESTGEAAGNLITETPAMRKDWQGKDKRGEDVRFENQKFVQWLMNKRANISAPEKGSMLKFFPDTGEVVSVENDSEDETGESYTYRWVIGLLLAGLVFVICVIWWFTRQKEPQKSPVTPPNSLELQSAQSEGGLRKPGESSNQSDDRTVPDRKETGNGNGEHNSFFDSSSSMGNMGNMGNTQNKTVARPEDPSRAQTPRGEREGDEASGD
ncbi:MAG: hypothetical protein IJ587_10370 [Synergistaceae bacterium]|nr:hypothetical protein [Synergistaceae bacterium]